MARGKHARSEEREDAIEEAARPPDARAGLHAGTPRGAHAAAPEDDPATPKEEEPPALVRADAAQPDLTRSEEILRRTSAHKGRGARRALAAALGALACFVALIVGVCAWYVHALNQQLALDEGELDSLEAVLQGGEEDNDAASEEEPYYVLVLGSDAREEDEASRSDTIMLVRVDPADALVTLVSIPRDTMVELEGHGTSKINAAYAYDGAAGAVSAVSEFAGVEISHYVEVHFEELEDLVDALGGVWVDVPVSNTQTGSQSFDVDILEGYQLLDGETALMFARERYGYLEGDLQRTENQRILVTAVIEAILDTPAVKLPGIVIQMASCVSTDYDVSDVLTLAQVFWGASDELTIYSAMAPSSTATIDGVSYVVTDEEAWAAMMARVDAGEDPDGEE